MQTYTKVITANGNYPIGTTAGTISLVQSGTGTWALNYSPDNGTTLIPMRDQGGAVVTGTASGGFNYQLANGTSNTNASGALQVYVTVTGASGLTLTVYVHG